MAGDPIAIVGGTGNSGKWVLKGAVMRGISVRLLARSPDKARIILQELFRITARYPNPAIRPVIFAD